MIVEPPARPETFEELQALLRQSLFDADPAASGGGSSADDPQDAAERAEEAAERAEAAFAGIRRP